MSRFFSVLRKQPLLEELRARGLLSQVTRASLETDLNKSTGWGVYVGADPSARSLHLGNLLPLMTLMHFYLNGYNAFPLVGGATGAVGDPSGRKTEREKMQTAIRERNVAEISAQMRQLLSNCTSLYKKHNKADLEVGAGKVQLVNNLKWWENVKMLEFLHTFGPHFRVNAMIGRESVRQRLQSEAGLGYNEFSYQIMQAFDFYHLYKHHNCVGQIGGHDQWGNIVAGCDLINRLREKDSAEPFGLTVPLLLAPSGEKFGKSMGNAVFLSKKLTSPYHLYQYLVQSPDDAVERYLRAFTFIPISRIAEIMQTHMANPEKRSAQRTLAEEVTLLVHGEEELEAAQTVTKVLFGDAESLNETSILNAFKGQGLAVQRAGVAGTPWRTLLADLSKRSKSECQRLLRQGGVYVGVQRKPVTSINVDAEDIAACGLLLVRVGKSEYYVVDASEKGK